MQQTELTPRQKQILTQLATELPYFCSSCLKIVDKAAVMRPFVLNRAQLHLHRILETQKMLEGRVRAVVLKGRQQGCTTYIQGRYFQRVEFSRNLSAFILAHQAESTLKIYSMTTKFYDNLPDGIQFPLAKKTEKALITEMGSGYTVGTAGSADVGRGMTVQLFHGSEVAFYENADEISTGLLQAVADVDGTEMIFESTANGPGNFFYDMFMGAVAGKNGFIPVFIPWYWQDEYKDRVPLLIENLDTIEQKYYAAYKDDGLTLEHLAWRRRKLASMGDKEWKFKQEYPFNPEEAFIRTEGRFFDMPTVYEARKRVPKPDVWKPLIIGIDQGRTGDDTEISRRRGTYLHPFETIEADDGDMRDMRLAGRVARIIDQENPDLVIFDTTNEHGALDRLHELGYKKNVKGCHFGSKARDKKRHLNKRVEMHVDFREWLKDPEASIPDEQKFLSEIGSIPVEKESSNQVMRLESKDKIKKELGWSPNKLDAAILTFAYPVRSKAQDQGRPRSQQPRPRPKWKSSLNTLRR